MFSETYRHYQLNDQPLKFQIFKSKLPIKMRFIFSLMGLLLVFAGVGFILANSGDLTNNTKIIFMCIGYAIVANGILIVFNNLIRSRTVIGHLQFNESSLELVWNGDEFQIPYDSIVNITYRRGMVYNYFSREYRSQASKQTSYFSHIYLLETTTGEAYLFESTNFIYQSKSDYLRSPIPSLLKLLSIAIGDSKLKRDKVKVRTFQKKNGMNVEFSVG